MPSSEASAELNLNETLFDTNILQCTILTKHAYGQAGSKECHLIIQAKSCKS
jgi:hypothetical protein